MCTDKQYFKRSKSTMRDSKYIFTQSIPYIISVCRVRHKMVEGKWFGNAVVWVVIVVDNKRIFNFLRKIVLKFQIDVF